MGNTVARFFKANYLLMGGRFVVIWFNFVLCVDGESRVFNFVILLSVYVGVCQLSVIHVVSTDSYISSYLI